MLCGDNNPIDTSEKSTGRWGGGDTLSITPIYGGVIGGGGIPCRMSILDANVTLSLIYPHVACQILETPMSHATIFSSKWHMS